MIPTGEATLGPFFPPRYVDAGANDLTQFEGKKAKGEVIEIQGCVVQEDGTPLENLIVEIWQADAQGIFRHPADPRRAQADPGFFGWGRAATGKDGRYSFRTIRPGAPAGRPARPGGPRSSRARSKDQAFSRPVMRLIARTKFFQPLRWAVRTFRPTVVSL